MRFNMNCKVCESQLSGRQTKFCSKICKMKYLNNKHQNYQTQQQRGEERRKQLIEYLGAECLNCKYNKNYSALEFHHLDSSTKSFGITLRECSNNKLEKLFEEAKKCILLCSNCHRELHNPHFSIKPN